MTQEEVKKMAEAHWEFQERWLRMVFVDAFIHGWKHAKEERENERNRG